MVKITEIGQVSETKWKNTSARLPKQRRKKESDREAEDGKGRQVQLESRCRELN
jgi:hypothetical protein